MQNKLFRNIQKCNIWIQANNTILRNIWKYEKIYGKLCNIWKYATNKIFKYEKQAKKMQKICKNIQKYAKLCTNMQKYEKICTILKICKNMKKCA